MKLTQSRRLVSGSFPQRHRFLRRLERRRTQQRSTDAHLAGWNVLLSISRTEIQLKGQEAIDNAERKRAHAGQIWTDDSESALQEVSAVRSISSTDQKKSFRSELYDWDLSFAVFTRIRSVLKTSQGTCQPASFSI
jgi:hypothetical protein